MRALVVTPGLQDSARLLNLAEPASQAGSLLVEMLAIGICGTDREIIQGRYGSAPPQSDHLVLGHESLGRVIEAPEGCGFMVGDLVAGIVRRPDPVPCSSCAVQEWDMCRNGLYTEHGIKGLHGFCAERFRLEPAFAVRVDGSLGELGVLLEPASILAKAWQQAERIAYRAHAAPSCVLVTGAGPIGLLATLMARQRGLVVHVLDQVEEGPKPNLVEAIGATYHTDLSSLAPLRNKFDFVVECTGSSSLVLEAMAIAGPNSVTCLTGISSGHRKVEIDLGGLIRSMVLENGVVFGSVNANRRHYDQAAQALANADKSWLLQLITRRVPLRDWQEAIRPSPGGVKTILVPG